MQKFKKILRNAALYALSIALVGAAPITAFADEPETYTYNAANGRWDSSKWVYDPATHVYVPAPPASPAPAKAPAVASKDSGATDAPLAADAVGDAPGVGGNASVSQNLNDNANTNVNTDASIKNGLNSLAGSGSAGVNSNLRAGDALSGDANADTTLVNSVHSTVDGETDGIARFTTNLYGDVVGDIMIGPSIANAQIDRNININSNTNINNNDAITNDVKVRALSGSAEVANNTTAGNAKSGNANAVANVLNLINTIIGANKSFIGTINIYGNLNGDIMVSPDFIPQLLADNSIERTEINMPLSMNINDDKSIVNNVKLNAATGDATVANNTGAGSATTGSSKTKLTVLNLTGHKVNAKNSLLVFVNVLGKWVGMIVDAPNATAAAFGNRVVSNTVNVSDNTNINNKERITNNIDLDAQSGSAAVAGNTQAGDATSGDATASANLANISSSEFNLTDWFGVLYINVFGTWIGSFGVDTAAGTVVPLSGMAMAGGPPNPGTPNLRFGFNPGDSSNSPSAAIAGANGGGGMDAARAAGEAYLAAHPQGANTSMLQGAETPKALDPSMIMTVGGFMAAGISSIWLSARRRSEMNINRPATPGLMINQ